MSLGAAVMTACCLTTSTYAWFAKNANAWVEDYELKIHTEEGLEISVDGVNFYDSIDKELLLKAIAAYRYNLKNPTAKKGVADLTQEDIETYSKVQLAPLSPDSNMDFWGFDSAKVQADPFCYIDENTNKYTTENLTDAARKNADYIPQGYVAFELTFRAIPSSSDAKDKYNLVFANKSLAGSQGTSYIKTDAADVSTVQLNNELMIPASKTTTEHPNNKYSSGDSITIDPADAMRIGVVTEGKQTLIYEPNQGYGSYAMENIPADAIDSSIADLYNPDLSPMVTYFNNTHRRGPLALPEYDASLVNTYKDFEDLASLGTFTRNADGKYNDVSITCYLWLEGYDADYLEGVDTSVTHFFLNFIKVEG